MSVTKIDVEAAPAETQADETLKALREEIKGLFLQRRNLRNRLIRF